MFDLQTGLFQDFPLHGVLSRLPWHSEAAGKRQSPPIAAVDHQDHLAFSNHPYRRPQSAKDGDPRIRSNGTPGQHPEEATLELLECGQSDTFCRTTIAGPLLSLGLLNLVAAIPCHGVAIKPWVTPLASR